MKRVRLVGLVYLTFVLSTFSACADDGGAPAGSGGQATAGTGSTAGAAGTQATQAGSSGSGNGGSGNGGSGNGGSGNGGSDFAACGAAKPNTTCVKESLCATVSCGMLTSQLSSGGCVRKTCTADTDCGADELCFPGPVVAQVDATSPRFAPTCTANGTRCDCVGLTVESGAKAYCAPKADVFAGFGCLTRPSIKNDCIKLAAWIASAKALLGTLTLEPTVATTAQSCITQASEYHDQSCQ